MVILIIVLFIAGMFALVLEAILPFGISAIIGILLMGVAGYLAFEEFGPGRASIYLLLATGASIALLRIVAVWGNQRMALTPMARRTPPPPTPTGPTEPAVGELVRVVQPLRPTGSIEWNERRFSARIIRQEIEVPSGASVVVRGRDSIFFLVDLAPETQPAPPQDTPLRPSGPQPEPDNPGEPRQ